jgi:hypothetical protein
VPPGPGYERIALAKATTTIPRIFADSAGNAPAVREYGMEVDMYYIEYRSFNPAIFEMLGVRICGYGPGASDLRAIEDHIGSRTHRSFTAPLRIRSKLTRIRAL